MSYCATQQDVLLRKLMEYYREPGRLDRMLSIINGESNISLRIVDWFATNYAKKNFTVYNLADGSRFKVYEEYKNRLRAYSKKKFDPFCRWDRITVPYKDGARVQTTIGQLNFFRWAFENNIIEYIEEHRGEIDQDMNRRNNTSRRSRTESSSGQKTRKKREELSVSATKSIVKEEVKVVVSFS